MSNLYFDSAAAFEGSFGPDVDGSVSIGKLPQSSQIKTTLRGKLSNYHLDLGHKPNHLIEMS